MADEDPGKPTPSLHPPSLGFGRKRRRTASESAEPPTSPASPETTEAAADSSPTTILDADDRQDTVVDRPALSEPPRVTAPATAPPPDSPPPLFADEVEAVPSVRKPREPEHEPAVDADRAGQDGAPSRPTRGRPSLLGGVAAAVATGAVTGLVVVGLTSASFRLCESVKGTSSCGGPGLLLLLAIMAAAVLLGSAMLRLFRLPDPGSTSFLAVGLLCVLTLLFLVDVAFDWWMIIAIPVISMVTFALSHWVTTALIEPADD